MIIFIKLFQDIITSIHTTFKTITFSHNIEETKITYTAQSPLCKKDKIVGKNNFMK